MESSSFSGSSKRAKAPANIANCLVDGCDADLSLCRDYHRRHKVCEAHSKTPKVTVGGRELRFCQQCSRFHSLAEFDEGKRSCRKRLDGHNRRRRKPQPDLLARSSSLDFSNQQGTRLLSFGAPQVLPSAMAGFSWPGGVVKMEDDPGLLCNNHHQPQQPNYSFPIQEASISQPFLDPQQVVGSDGALSLLSSASPITRELGLSSVVPAERLPGLQYGGRSHQYPFGHESKQVVSSTDSHGSDASTLHFPGMFQHGADGSSASGPHQTLTFTWE